MVSESTMLLVHLGLTFQFGSLLCKDLCHTFVLSGAFGKVLSVVASEAAIVVHSLFGLL